jgi:membrane-associated phospholipid phosphatase
MNPEFTDRWKKIIISDFTAMGGLVVYCFICLFFLIFGEFIVLLKLIMGFVLVYGIIITIRSVYFKDRPVKYVHTNYVEKMDASSFPSIHAGRSTILYLILIEFFNNLYVSISLGILILLVCYSRIYLKKHDLKDVSAGIIVGLIVFYITRLV